MQRVHFITLSRSDYASLRPVALAALGDPGLRMKVVAGGSHLLERFGRTMDSIRAEGYPELEAVEFLREGDSTDAEMAAAYSRAVEAFVRLLERDRPDGIFLVGDRWEMLAPATAASMLRIPIAHHSGGDITQGSADNQTRYVLSTLAHLHFTALEEHADRLLRMGEEPWRVAVTGEPALAGLAGHARALPGSRAALGLGENEPFVLATFHPTSYDTLDPEGQIALFVRALDAVEGKVVLTAPNPDPGSGSFYEVLSAHAKANPRVRLFASLGSERYYAAMAQARFMIGNSSSGIWEAPSFGLPAVNIGSRQDGRTRGPNVVDARLDLGEIQAAIRKAADPRFRESLKDRRNPYVKEDAVERILSGLKTGRARAELLAKVFVDPLKAASARAGS